MHKRWLWIPLGVLLLLGLAAGIFLVVQRPGELGDNGQLNLLDTNALDVGWGPQDAGIDLSDLDEVTPGIDEPLPWNDAGIQIRRARLVHIAESSGSLVKSWWTVERVPAERSLA